MTAPIELRRQRWQRMAIAVHALGPRVVFELLDELARHHHAMADDIDCRLAKYAALDRRLLRGVGGDRFAPPPLRIVAGGQH